MGSAKSKQVPNKGLPDISVDLIDEPERELRSTMIREKLDELVESIRILGIIQPLRLARKGERYEVICGHRRLLAARALGLPTVPAIVADSNSETALVESVHENLIREDVSAIDLARWLQQVKNEKGLTNTEISTLFGKSHGWAGQYLVLLKCDGGIQAAVAAGQIDIVSARRLQSIEDSNIRHSLLTHAVRGGASQQTISNWVAQEKIRAGGRSANGDLEESGGPDEEPPPLLFSCFYCMKSTPSDEMINIPFCPQCFQTFKSAIELEAAAAEGENKQELGEPVEEKKPAALEVEKGSAGGGSTGQTEPKE